MKWNHSVFHVRETINNYYVRISGILYLIVQWKFENSRLLEILGFCLTRSSKNVSIVFIVVSTFSSKPWFFFFFFASRNIQNKTKKKYPKQIQEFHYGTDNCSWNVKCEVLQICNVEYVNFWRCFFILSVDISTIYSQDMCFNKSFIEFYHGITKHIYKLNFYKNHKMTKTETQIGENEILIHAFI